MKMKKILLGILFTSIILLSGACKKEEPLYTAAEINATKIKQTISEFNPDYISVELIYYDSESNTLKSESVAYSDSFKVDGTFLKVGDNYYSLENMSSFKLLTIWDFEGYLDMLVVKFNT